MNTYRVTVIIADLDVRETYTVQRLDEWKARTAAMGEYLQSDNLHPAFTGQFVDYEVDELQGGGEHDTWSSVSRQHFIETGEYLPVEPPPVTAEERRGVGGDS